MHEILYVIHQQQTWQLCGLHCYLTNVMHTASVLKWQDNTTRYIGLERCAVETRVKGFYMELIVLI